MICLVNPKSRSGRGQKLQSYWRKALLQADPAATWHECHSGQDCRQMAELARQTVAAVGGDGTINNVINGLMASQTDPAMAVLYSGTSPDFCKFHHIPLAPDQALAVLLAGRTKVIDLAEINYYSEQLNKNRAFFASSCNIGLGAATAAFANRWRRYLGDLAGTGLGLLRAMLLHSPFKSEIIIDGHSHLFERTNHIIVLKNPHIASSLRLDLNCRADDGRLWALVVHDHSRPELLGLIGSLYHGTLPRRKKVYLAQGAHIEIRTDPIQSLEFDGDPQGLTPALIEIKPKSLKLICGDGHD